MQDINLIPRIKEFSIKSNILFSLSSFEHIQCLLEQLFGLSFEMYIEFQKVYLQFTYVLCLNKFKI
jgi:hypothetical protein